MDSRILTIDRVKELEEELSKVKLSPTTSTVSAQ